MKSFQQMAQDLSKSGAEIAAKLTEGEADLWHMATGVAGEAGELLDAIKKHVVYKRELDRENVVEELGDLRFYMAGLMNRLGITEEEILSHNNRKLSKRYASGAYSNAQAVERADKVEAAEELSPRHPDYGVATEEDVAEDWVAREGRLAQYGEYGEGLRTEAELQAEAECREPAIEGDDFEEAFDELQRARGLKE
ncbi:MazG-like pyrophosphatase [Rhodobacter phage RcTitan]|uniref:Nucleotide pyrophosphohydrolase n=1 Tax=Rhodobacter phage RcTitan TaxID=1662330 RepID=A0A0K1LKQ6_9CAUD|nr:MazG-like pyrophosphatase [Rhodobacter phage RcTitan]AKU43067.1 nucleotide pyrophosphohydrolase [Rhodobacter phage RcTitan]